MSDERKVFTNNSATELKNVWDERKRGMEESKEGGKEGGKKEGRKEGKSKPLISLEIENCIRSKEAKKSQYFIKDIAHSLNACSVPSTEGDWGHRAESSPAPEGNLHLWMVGGGKSGD